MKKRIYTAAGLFLAAALVLGGCGKEKVPESEFATADEAKEALTSAETIEIYFDLYGSKRKTKIVADGKVAGYLQKNTVYINEEEWFSIDYVEDEPINDREGSGTTYGYYDASGTCLGYAQEQYVDTSYGKDTRLIFLDVDETPLDYQSSRSGRILYDENDEEIGSGKIGRSGVSLLDQWYTNLYCAVFKTETDGARQIDFMEAGARSGRHHPKVVGNFGQVDRAGFHSRRSGYKAVQVLGRINQVFGLPQIQPGNGGEIGDNGADIAFIGVDAGADGSAAHINIH